MSRFSSANGSVRARLDIYTAVSGIALIVMVLGCLYLVFHNMEHGSTREGVEAGTPFEIIESR
ncbi:MAG: hypothetical protein MK101_06260 [Phycisphaerales bacterium]|nr:hypothetical protein [Phycisphaerales bacterium]